MSPKQEAFRTVHWVLSLVSTQNKEVLDKCFLSIKLVFLLLFFFFSHSRIFDFGFIGFPLFSYNQLGG